MNCLLIVAAFCFSDANSAAIDRASTVGRFASVKIGDVTAEILIGSDALADYDASQMARACEAQACIAYHKWCEEADGRYSCSYTLGDTIYAQPVFILRAPNQLSLAATESKIAVFANNSRTDAVPMRLFTAISAARNAPYCRPEGGRLPKCPHKPVGS